MALVVASNMAALNTYNTLKKNDKKMANNLERVSSGMKINSAKDDASGYAISEKMRVQLRSLEQDITNSQNGISLMKVAEGAVSSTIDILRTFKEKALDAANDTNTDIDRATIQKELDELIDQVDDNANVTYNGKYLINGSMEVKIENDREQIIAALNTEWIENSLDHIEEAYGLTFRGSDASVREITVEFEDKPGAFEAALCSWTIDRNGKADSLKMIINTGNISLYDKTDPSGWSTDRIIMHELTHAIMASNIANMHTLPTFITEGTASYIQGRDDWTTTLATHDKSWLQNQLLDDSHYTASSNDPYDAGYIFLRYITAQSAGDGKEVMHRFMNSLSHSSKRGVGMLDEAVQFASKGKFSSRDDMLAKMLDDYDIAGNMTDFLKAYCNIDLTNEDVGSTLGSDAGGSKSLSGADVVSEAGSTEFWYLPGGKYSSLGDLLVEWPDGYQERMGKLTLQTGTKAGQSMKVSFKDMRAEAMGLKDKYGKKISVKTREDANNTIRVVDQALRKALEQQTTIGSMQSRLEFTIENLTTAYENVQNAESTIRDADMAKEMTDYSKNNVLLQAAQSMLAQANQNSSNVLSLLQ